MITLLYNPCLLVIIIYAFGLVEMQTDNTLILKDSKFKALKHKELVKANIIIKLIKQLLLDILLTFNKYIFRQEGDSILLVQKG
jgi:hypothetical protein